MLKNNNFVKQNRTSLQWTRLGPEKKEKKKRPLQRKKKLKEFEKMKHDLFISRS